MGWHERRRHHQNDSDGEERHSEPGDCEKQSAEYR
jgi:hypothetical protein